VNEFREVREDRNGHPWDRLAVATPAETWSACTTASLAIGGGMKQGSSE